MQYTRYNCYLSVEQLKALGRMAEVKGIKRAELIRRAIDFFLESNRSKREAEKKGSK